MSVTFDRRLRRVEERLAPPDRYELIVVKREEDLPPRRPNGNYLIVVGIEPPAPSIPEAASSEPAGAL